MRELMYFASLLGRGGYEHHAREVLRQLYKKGIKVGIKEMIKFHTRPVLLDEEIKNIIQISTSTEVSPQAPAFWLCVPSAVRCTPGRKCINWTTFEADRICSLWVEKAKAIDLTIVTASYLKEAWMNSGAPEAKLAVVGEGVNPEFFNPNVPTLELYWRGKEISKVFENRIMLVAECSARKNITNAVQAYLQAFQGREDVCLILKLGKMSTDIHKYVSEIKGLEKVYVFLYSLDIPETLVPQFFQLATHYYTLTHAEGWDLNCVQMGALGKVVIAPYHSAYLDYLDESRAFLITKNPKVPAQQDNNLGRLFENANWWNPDFDEAVEVLRAAVNNKQLAEQKRQNFNRYVLDNLTWDKQVDKLIDVLASRGFLDKLEILS